MKNKNLIKVAGSSLILGVTLSLPSLAAQNADANQQPVSETIQQAANSIERQSSDAWREGKLDTIYLFNRHLNNFTINPEINGDSVVLTGEVKSDVDKELAEQLAKGMDGVNEVSNHLKVVPSDKDRSAIDDADRDFSDQVEDATLTAEIKTKLLANSETGGLKINVDTTLREVVLTGEVDSAAEKALAGEIAEQVDGVASVNNNLTVEEQS